MDQSFAQGFEHFWMVSDAWAKIGMTTEWFQWHSRQLRTGAIAEAERSWDLSKRHIVRPDSYKGEQEVTTLPGVQYDLFTTPGMLMVFGIMAQVRGLNAQTQVKIVTLLRKIVPLASFPDGVAILPNLPLKVVTGQLKPKRFFAAFGEEAKPLLRQRLGYLRCRVKFRLFFLVLACLVSYPVTAKVGELYVVGDRTSQPRWLRGCG